MISAFGVDHGEIAKADDKYRGHGAPSAGRRLTASVGGGIHPLVAGRKGKKARTYGNTAVRAIGGGAAGGGAGALLGLAATRGKLGGAQIGAGVGGVAGGQAGIQRAVTVNQRKGYYKEQS